MTEPAPKSQLRWIWFAVAAVGFLIIREIGTPAPAAKPTAPAAPAVTPAAPPPTAAERAAAEEKEKAQAMAAAGQFRAMIAKVDDGMISEVAPDGSSPNRLLIAVSDRWHYQPKQIRLQTAQALQRLWATAFSPDRPDHARIRLLDQTGNEVGGSRVWGGSVIWVAD